MKVFCAVIASIIMAGSAAHAGGGCAVPGVDTLNPPGAMQAQQGIVQPARTWYLQDVTITLIQNEVYEAALCQPWEGCIRRPRHVSIREKSIGRHVVEHVLGLGALALADMDRHD